MYWCNGYCTWTKLLLLSTDLYLSRVDGGKRAAYGADPIIIWRVGGVSFIPHECTNLFSEFLQPSSGVCSWIHEANFYPQVSTHHPGGVPIFQDLHLAFSWRLYLKYLVKIPFPFAQTPPDNGYYGRVMWDNIINRRRNYIFSVPLAFLRNRQCHTDMKIVILYKYSRIMQRNSCNWTAYTPIPTNRQSRRK